MVRIEKNKLIIEVDSNMPTQTLYDLLGAIPVCIQATQTGPEQAPDSLPDSIHFLLELYRAMLPNETQVELMFQERGKAT